MNINTFVASTCPMIRGRFFRWMMGRNFRNIDTTSGMAWREVFWVCGKYLQRSQDLCFGGVPIYKTIKSQGRSLFGSWFLFEKFVSFKSKGLLIALSFVKGVWWWATVSIVDLFTIWHWYHNLILHYLSLFCVCVCLSFHICISVSIYYYKTLV